MKQIRIFRSTFLVGLSTLWWFADTPVWAALTNFFGWRAVLMQYSGVLAIGVMIVAMVLAVRPVLFEPALGELDKMYRLHKWLGISGLVLSVSHWLISEAPKWFISQGWMAPLVHGPRPPMAEDPIRQFFLDQRDLGGSIGEWAFFAAEALMVLTLIKRLPYKHFFKTHHLIAVAYVALVGHSVILLKFDNWGGLLGLTMALFMMASSVAALMVLFCQVSVKRQLVGEVVGIRHHDTLQVIEIDIAFQGRWASHEAGQFAFVTLHADEGAHPCTISSAWANDGRLTFIINALGDYTSTLPDRLILKDVVTRGRTLRPIYL